MWNSFDYNNLFSILIDITIWITIFNIIFVVIMENRNPVKTIAWVIVLLFLPYIGFILYIFFGRNVRNKRIISSSNYQQVTRRISEQMQHSTITECDGRSLHLMKLFQGNNESIPFPHNNIEIYTTGSDKRNALFQEIEKSRHHIHLQYYIFNDDKLGNALSDLLIRKAHEGIMVRIIYDDVACWKVKGSFYERLKEEGIEVRSFLKVRYPLFTDKINYRNHRKLVVIDGKVGFIGGMNIADRYVEGVEWGVWRDTHLKITGQAVYGLQASFLSDWYFVNRTVLSSRDYFPPIAPVKSASTDIVQIVTSAPNAKWNNIEQGLLTAIAGAENYIYIQTPYFLPSESIIRAMQLSALAQVDIRLMLSERSDLSIIDHASRSYLTELIDAGVKVYFYQKGFLHSKAIVWDDKYATVGSTNMDFRSFEQNFEINAFIYGCDTARKLKAAFLSDLQSAQLIRMKEWKKRPKLDKLKESLCRILSPLF